MELRCVMMFSCLKFDGIVVELRVPICNSVHIIINNNNNDCAETINIICEQHCIYYIHYTVTVKVNLKKERDFYEQFVVGSFHIFRNIVI